jgi:uncharacterized protein YndB with AHSA1/START domain
MNNEPIVIEQDYPVSIESVWQAITDKDAMIQWYFDFPEFKPEVGFEFQFMGGPDESRQYLHLCKITEVIAYKKLAYSWRYDGYEGITLVTFELIPEENHTKLRLTHVGLETFPASNPDFGRGNFVEGWNWIIGTSLKEYLLKNDI